MPGRSSRSIVLFVLCLVSWPGLVPAAENILVDLFEDLPQPWTWQEPALAATDHFEAPALGFVRVPAKLNRRGIEIDRSGPYLLHARASLCVPPGPHRLILRARGSARLLVDGATLAETGPVRPNSAGHEDVPEIAPPEDARWRDVAPGDQERIVAWSSDGQPHRVQLWVLIGEKKTRPETGELSVSVVGPGGVPILVGNDRVELTDEGWTAFAAQNSVESRGWRRKGGVSRPGAMTLTGKPGMP